MRVPLSLEDSTGKLIVFAFAACLALASFGCGAPAAEDAGEEPGDEPSLSELAEAAAAEDIPDRSKELERDEYSKPQEVYDFVGIGEGDTVIDVAAGGGYNTYLLAERVGPTGRVIAAEGNNDGLAARLERGDMAGAANVEIVAALSELADESVDAVVVIRWYHLLPDPPAFVAELARIMKPGGTVGVVEVRLNQDEGHDMTSHRVGEQTVIADFEGGGFTYDGESDILRRDDDDYTLYGGPYGSRYMTDRMLLKFSKAR